MRDAFAPGIFAARKIFEKFSKSISVLTPILCDRGVRKVAAHNKNPAPTYEESVNFSNGVSFYPPFCAIGRWEEFLQEQALWALAECISGRWWNCASQWKLKILVFVFRFDPRFATKGSKEKKLCWVFRFTHPFVTKESRTKTLTHLAKCITKRHPNCATIWKWIIFRKSGKKGRSRCLQSEGTFSRRSNCIWKAAWNCTFLWKWWLFRNGF